MSSAKMIGIEMTPSRQYGILCGDEPERDTGWLSSSTALEYVVFQLDDDIVFKLNENCTVFNLMKLFKNHSAFIIRSFICIHISNWSCTVHKLIILRCSVNVHCELWMWMCELCWNADFSGIHRFGIVAQAFRKCFPSALIHM